MDSDPEVVLVEKIEDDEISTDKDSGMESATGSKDETPERKPSTPEEAPKQSEPVKPAVTPEAAPVAADSSASASAVTAPPAAPAAAPSAPSTSRPTASSSPPQQPTKTVARTSANDYDDEPDETLGERLWGLTEMFPEPVRQLTGTVSDLTVRSVKGLYSLTCNVSWIFFTSSMILLAPVVFEVERAQMEEMQKSQQKQVLLGPGAAVGGGAPGGMPALPPMAAAR
ncbi:mitochondrial import receptor subunit TOM22 homolog [Anopheles maculipalpis]|uniref:mitochondrial import receptor subunit TOM22 homolog n=1 Tax=Anopheles maculipalpis TaxID=1496333 RepID=UPI0021598E2A|nr:mitochondrial import receptor subunit TOM22 homolog [Anopheles maculipalpis]